ncbi:uncharacterized protein LOC113230149 isoform X1 [Hyposmocoma kahamanoa]|uniref:uncharacterized protein LOC113230149 isoform X1 n=1 Tax=Hyposmocoma kahamanoa TaxID=1477025 RepID=UPI000E6D6A5A|nr:uncharacterized protein LOC113230149 isoform X1 [Hyposmocoma kahamanoa]
MRCLMVLSVFVAALGWCYGKPAPAGIGAFAYQDSSGNRYGGTYGLQDGKAYSISGDDVTSFNSDGGVNNFQSLDSFFPEYFKNFETILQEAFADHIDHQRVALDAARKAFDLTSNRAGYVPNFAFDSRSGGFGNIPDFGNFGFGMPMGGSAPPFGFPMGPMGPMGPNSAFASAMAGPGYKSHKIALNPANPRKPNVDVTRMSDAGRNGGRQFYSVSSSSYSSSANLNGQQVNDRGGETIINDNGVISRYSLKDN